MECLIYLVNDKLLQIQFGFFWDSAQVHDILH